MAKVKPLFIFLLLHLSLNLFCQSQLKVEICSQGIFCNKHTIAPGETLFSLGRMYNVSTDDIKQFNPATQWSVLSIGQNIEIPVFQMNVSKSLSDKTVFELLYEVQSGDTFFSLSRASGLSVEKLKKLNKLKTNQLNPGQVLVVGYYNSSPNNPESELSHVAFIGLPSSSQSAEGTAWVSESGKYPEKAPIQPTANPIQTIGETPEAILDYSEERGVAIWNQEWKTTAGFYVLHRKAPINSIIEIENPMFGRRAFGKVSGRIPSSLYSSDIILIVSDGLAQHLGVIDPRFFVKVRYLQPD